MDSSGMTTSVTDGGVLVSGTPVNEAEAVRKHRPWVEKLARKYAGRGGDQALHDDLVQEGLLALVQAARAWRPDGGAGFLTYATKSIARNMRQRIGRNPVVCRSARDRDAGMYELPSMVSMDAPLHDGEASGNDRHESPLDAVLSVPASQEDTVAEAERADIVRRVLATLPERDAQIIIASTNGDDYRTIAARYGIGKTRVEQIVRKWTPTLRKRLAKELGDDC